MPEITFGMPSFSSPMSYIGVFLFFAGMLLVLAGWGVVRVEKIEISLGRRSWIIGLLFVLVGIGLMTVDFSSSSPLVPSTLIAPSSPAATPTSPVLSQLLFGDDFNNNGNEWPNGTEERRSVMYIEGGAYHVIGLPDFGNWLSSVQIPTFDNFYLETKASRIEADKTNGIYGLFFRATSSTNYVFTIDVEKRNYSLQVVDISTDKYRSLTSGYSPKIVPGLSINKLGVLCTGDRVALYINDYLMDSIQDSSSLAGNIGFVIGAGDHIAFDYVRVWGLTSS